MQVIFIVAIAIAATISIFAVAIIDFVIAIAIDSIVIVIAIFISIIAIAMVIISTAIFCHPASTLRAFTHGDRARNLKSIILAV